MALQDTYPQAVYAAPPIRSLNGSVVASASVPAYDGRQDQGRIGAAVNNVKGAVEQLDPGQLINKDFVLEMAEGGLPFMGAFGNVAGAAIGFLVADNRAQKQTQAIIEQYREEIAGQLSISPEAVDVRALLMAAQHNKGLRQAINHIQGERGAHPFVNVAGLIGMAAGVGLFLPLLAIPGPGWLTGMIAGGLGYMGGQYLGEKLLAPDEKQNPLTQMDEIRAKVQNGQPVDAIDIFALRVTQNEGLNERIINQYGEPYYKLSGQDKHYAMNMVRGGHELCARDAALVNAGGNLDNLMFGPMPEPVMEQQLAPAEQTQGQWASRVGSRAPARGNYADMIRQQQAAAQMLHTER